jgi:glycosyltransferase involved in cell wall biosynthesis
MTVTVICLCYNQSQYIGEAIASVFAQTHPEVQLIIVDDASTDDSAAAIRDALASRPGVELIVNQKNLGNCAAFNRGWKRAKGEFIIDLAGDDILFPTRIEIGLREFQLHDASYGVQFGDAELINETGMHLGLHSDRFPGNGIPQGSIYKELIDRYFICSPSMMIRRKVLEKLDGYDERLAYEDFDFWIRSAREFNYCYSDKPLVKKRVTGGSLGSRQYGFNPLQMRSTFRVCEKIMNLNRTSEEFNALERRIRYELKKSIQFGHVRLALNYISLFFKNRNHFRLSSPESIRK